MVMLRMIYGGIFPGSIRCHRQQYLGVSYRFDDIGLVEMSSDFNNNVESFLREAGRSDARSANFERRKDNRDICQTALGRGNICWSTPE